MPYPGTMDYEYEMSKSDVRKEFNENLLSYTDRMHPRGLPLFNTRVEGRKLLEAVREFWQELNEDCYVNQSKVSNLGSSQVN